MLIAAWGGSLLVSEQAERQLLARAEAVAILHDNRLERAISQTLTHLRLLSRISRLSCERLGIAPGLPVYAQIKGVAMVR